MGWKPLIHRTIAAKGRADRPALQTVAKNRSVDDDFEPLYKVASIHHAERFDDLTEVACTALTVNHPPRRDARLGENLLSRDRCPQTLTVRENR